MCYLRMSLPEIPPSSQQGGGKDRGAIHSALPHSLEQRAGTISGAK